MMDRSFGGWILCVSLILRSLPIWISVFARLCAIQQVQQWPSSVGLHAPHVLHLRKPGELVPVYVSYTPRQLLSMSAAAPVTPALVCRLKELCICRDIPRRRTRRGGRRKQRHIPVLVHTILPTYQTRGSPSRSVTPANLTYIPLSNSITQHADRPLRITSFNAQSLGPREKRTAVCEFMLDWNVDIMFVQETWLKPKGDEGKQVDLAPSGYSVRSFPRSHLGGGIAVVYRDTLASCLAFNTTFPFPHTSFELVQITLSLPQRKNVCFWCIYRTSPSVKNKLTDTIFFSEFPDLLDLCNNTSASTVIVGDVNFHYDKPTRANTAKMIDLLDIFGLSQSVSQPTQKCGHTLDWVMFRPEDQVVQSTSVTQELSSDHYCVVCDLNIPAPQALVTYTNARNLRAMDREAFKHDLRLMVSPISCPSINDLNSTLRTVLDRHAPVTRYKIKVERLAPWYPAIRDELIKAKKERRRAEEQWLTTGLIVYKQIYAAAKRRVTKIVQQAKTSYYSAQVSSGCVSARQFFSLCSRLCGNNKSSPLPTSYPVNRLPEVFCNYFTTKVSDICSELDRLCTASSVSFVQQNSDTLVSSVFDVFHPVTEQDVKKVILKSKPTSCTLDPIPTPLLRDHLDELLPTITNIVNDSILSGSFPSALKTAVVKPLLKKSSLDKNNLKNYRPVSNLSFLSKIIERIVLTQLFEYLNAHALLSPNQSAYRPSHSTETALLRVTNDILLALDNREVSLLTLLDLSAAFDTIDHPRLLQTIHVHYGISGTALSWFHSYLSNRTQSVIIDGFSSEPKSVSIGVPQGSVLGPVLFIMYTMPLQSLVTSHAVSNQAFADDTQLYSSCCPEDTELTVTTMQRCIGRVKSWMTEHKLKLNDDKTEALLIHSKKSFSACPKPCALRVGNFDIPFSPSARNLGFIISEDMSLDNHIKHICSSAYAALRQISSIRHYLTVGATKTLVCAFVLSRLDYCNALLAGCPKRSLDKLQKVQNSAARLVLKAKKRHHITPLLKSLHWLPVEARIQYKLSLCCHNFFSESCPSYISDLLSVYSPSRQLRSSADSRTLCIPRTNTKTFGERAFSFTAPKQWKTLPRNIRHIGSTTTFKQALKTHLYRLHYPQ